MAEAIIVTDHLGKTFSSKGAMLKHYGLSYKAFDRRIASGMSLKDALTIPSGNLKSNKIPCVDHLGNKYESKHSMLQHYGICQTAFEYRIKKLNMSLEDALTQPHKENKSTAIKCQDHMGNTFSSKIDMCDYWRMPRVVFFRRIRDGWTLEKALTEPIRNTNPKIKIKDHLGNEFDTLDAMCKHWNISKKQYMLNIRNNCTIQQALTTCVEETSFCFDHLGNKFASINAMCKQYGITKTTLRSRIELGWTLDEILKNPSKKLNHIPTEDHLGNKYKTQKDMLNAYNVHELTYKHRKSLGWSLQECLEGKQTEPIKDHLGNVYGTILELCLYWNIRESTYHGRMNKQKWSLEKTLTNITLDSYDSFGPNLKICQHIKNEYYTVTFENHQYIWSFDQIMDYYHENILYKISGIQIIKRINDTYYLIKTSADEHYIMDRQTVNNHLKKVSHYLKMNKTN